MIAMGSAKGGEYMDRVGDDAVASIAAMEFLLLGPLEVRDGDRVAELGGAKQRALLALLLLDAGRVVSADRLIDELWGDDVPASARKMVHVHVHNLRKVLGADAVRTHPA